MGISIDLKEPLEERIKKINSISNVSLLNALLEKKVNSTDENILKEWETTKAVIKSRIMQLQENESIISVDNTSKKKNVKKSNVLSLISLVLTGLYLIYLIYYVSSTYVDATSSVETAEELGTALGTVLAIRMAAPHIIVTSIAFIFNIVTVTGKYAWSALTTAILYAVAMLLMPFWFMFVIIQMVLCFISFAKFKKKATL